MVSRPCPAYKVTMNIQGISFGREPRRKHKYLRTRAWPLPSRLWCLLAGLAVLATWTRPLEAGDAAPPARPNIVIVLVDDMGFSDIGCYGSEIPTPNLDKLAANGLRFTQFYNTGRCCPSRASLLTGLYSHQAGVGHMVERGNVPGYLGHLNDKCVTIAEVLRDAGYFTAMSGKWHLGHEQGVVPSNRGFMRSLEAPAGGFYYGQSQKAALFLDGKQLENDDPVLPRDWYTTDLWTEFGIRFIDEALAAKKPYFLYLAYNAPHFPLQAPLDEIKRFRGTYKVGWDKLRDQRLANERMLGILDLTCELSPRAAQVKAWDALDEKEQDRFDHIMAIYAAVVAHLDTAMGRLVDALRQRGTLDNTLILFMSDNGGNAEGGPEGITRGENLGGPMSMVYCGQSWATLENTPLRRYKHFNHEGGIATPLIAHWPARITDHGALRRQPGHLIDLMTTCVELAGATYPTTFNGYDILPMEGRSLVPAFSDLPIARDALFWEHEGNAAIRVGDMKLVRAGRNGDWELHDLAKDRSEMHDLAPEKPDLAKELAARWDAWAVRAQVKPYPNGGKQDGKKADQ
jgi:arylsulfatase A-like enzyme